MRCDPDPMVSGDRGGKQLLFCPSKKNGLIRYGGLINEAAIKKHEIYNKLGGLSGQDLGSVADFIDFMKHKKKQPTQKTIIKLQRILKGCDVDFEELKKFEQESWNHLEEEVGNE